MATGTLTPTPYQTTLDANGNPVSGALITTYLAGTSTLAATYTDVTLVTPNANPIVADSAGRWVAYLTPGASYKFVITDAASVAIRTQDNISATPASAVNLDVTGTAGEALTAGQAVYLSDGSGSKVAGQWYKADSGQTYSSILPEIGMVPASIANGQQGTIRLAGQVTGLSSLTIGSTYYVSAAGAITLTAPLLRRALGVADSTSSLILTPNPVVPNADNGLNDFRLTLESGVPVSATDQTAKTTLYCTPAGKGTRLALFDALGTATVFTTAEFSIAVPATTSQMYDVYCYANAGVPTLELLAWTNDTTRATAIGLATVGVYVKSGDITRRYLGSFRTTTVSGQTEDSAAKRYVWNYNNRVRRALLRQETTASWNYSTATIRQANASTANQVDVVVGVAEVAIDVSLHVAATNSTGGVTGVAGIGEDSTTIINAGQTGFGYINLLGASVIYAIPTVRLVKTPAVGRHFYAWLEYSGATVTTTWYGSADPLGIVAAKAGLSGTIEG